MALRVLVFVVVLTGCSAALAATADDSLLLQISGLHEPAPESVPTVPPIVMAAPGGLDEDFRQDKTWCVKTSGSSYNNGVKNYNCEATMDGDTKTVWDPVSFPKGHNRWWIQYNLGEPRRLTGMQIMSMGDTLHDIKTLAVQAAESEDADFDADGKDIGQFHVASTNEAQDLEFQLKPHEAVQHIRLLITATHGGWQPWVREIGFAYGGEAQ